MRRIAPAVLLLIALAAPAAALFSSASAGASVAYDSPYTYEQTFGTAMRLLRVDLGVKVLEKDDALGYVLFEYKSPESGSRVSNGAMELVREKDRVHVTVQLPAMPSYHEQMVIDMLARKLVAEHGDAPRPPEPPKQPAPPPPDGGPGAGGGEPDE